MELDNRKATILTTIVKEHIRCGEPVGSKTLSGLLEISASPATIRNEMATLFDMGFLEQPHTSAGRVPSHLGYRFYVNRLRGNNPISSEDKKQIDALFNIMNPDPDKLLADAAQALATLTNCVSISASSPPRSVFVKRIEIIRATNNAVLVLMIASNGVIKSKLCRVGFSLNDKLCEFFTSFTNGKLAGKTLEEINVKYIRSVAVSLGEYSAAFNPLLAAVFGLCEEIAQGQLFVRGETNLLSYKELEKSVLDILDILSDKDELERITEKCEDDITVFIGKENSSCQLSGASVIIAKYPIGEINQGILALIGPVRMDYARVLSQLKYFSQNLEKILSDISENDNKHNNI